MDHLERRSEATMTDVRSSASAALNTTRRARILVVDDHPLVRRGLHDLIGHTHDLEICGEAGDGPEALRACDELQPDLMLVDISLPEGHGIELIKQIKARNEHVKLLVSSMHDESLYAERALRAGALGYINKQEAMEKLVDAIRVVLTGKVYLSNRMTERTLNRFYRGDEASDAPLPVQSLTDRELEVFEMIGQGLTTREIANKIHRSIKTIETYRENIKSKLHLKNASELSRHAVQWVLENNG